MKSVVFAPMLWEGRGIGVITVGASVRPAVFRQGDRAPQDVRRPGGDRDPERAAVQRDEGGARTANARSPKSCASSRARRPTCSRCSTRSRERAARLCDASAASMYLIEGDVLRHLASKGRRPTRSSHVEALPIDRESHFGSRAARGAQHPGTRHARGRGRYPRATSWRSASAIGQSIVVPLIAKDRRIGTILLRRDDVRPVLRQARSRCCETFGDQAAIAHRERAAVPRDPGQEPAARDRQPAQVGIPREHVARAAHAAQRHHRLFRSAARAPVRRPQRQAGRLPQGHPLVGTASAQPDQRHPRPVEGRGRAHGARARRRSTCRRRSPMR